MSGALAGLRVLDLTRYIPGPYCTLLLADLGADVVKIEEPGVGDAVRALPPAVGEDSALHAALNRHKRSVVADLRTDGGTEVVRRLAARADVLVESNRPGTLARRGLGPDLLLARNPRLVYCSISGYGQQGPLADRAGHDVNYAARAGLLSALHAREGALPLLQPADMSGALFATIGILAALVARATTGRGQVVDASLFGASLALLTVPLARMLAGGNADELTGTFACYGAYRCADGGQVSVGALEPKFWEALTRGLGLDELAGRQWSGGARREETRERVAAAFAGRDRDAWADALDGDCCVEPVLSPREAAEQPAARPFLADQPVAGGATLRTVAAPFALSATPLRAPSAAPRLGEHTDAVLADAGYAPDEIASLRAAGAVA